MDEYIGQIIDDRFEILDTIRSGGMSRIFKAFDRRDELEVALKMLDEEFLLRCGEEAGRMRRRFHREARLLERLQDCEEVVRVLAFRAEGANDYIAMELLVGRNLRTLFDRRAGRLDPAQFLKLARDLVKGLKHIHAHRILHRDLAPDNIFLEDRGRGETRVKFLDFGISKFIEGEGDAVTSMPTMVGKPGYLSPEQTRSEELTAGSDTYSLGVVLYEMLTGALPIDVASFAEVAKIRKVAPKPLADFKSSTMIPEELRALIMACLRKKPTQRPTVDEIEECLDELSRRHSLGEDISGAFADWEFTDTLEGQAPKPIGLADPSRSFAGFELEQCLSRDVDQELWLARDEKDHISREIRIVNIYDQANSSFGAPNQALKHSTIPEILASGEYGGFRYQIQKSRHDTDLQSSLEQKEPMPPGRILLIGQSILAALNYAHNLEPPVFHGRLCPQVVRLDEFDAVTVEGWGCFQDARSRPVISDSCEFGPFCAPEIMMGAAPSAASDLYSFSCILYSMIQGHPPFAGTWLKLGFQHTVEKAPAFSAQTEAELGAGLLDLVREGLEKNPADRPSSAAFLRIKFARAFAQVSEAENLAEETPQKSRKWRFFGGQENN